MPQLASPHALLPGVLTGDDLRFIQSACRKTLVEEDVPCFSL